MRSWYIVENSEEWCALVDSRERKGEIPKPTQFPCLVCPRVTTDPKFAVTIHYPVDYYDASCRLWGLSEEGAKLFGFTIPMGKLEESRRLGLSEEDAKIFGFISPEE